MDNCIPNSSRTQDKRNSGWQIGVGEINEWIPLHRFQSQKGWDASSSFLLAQALLVIAGCKDVSDRCSRYLASFSLVYQRSQFVKG
jgi:hypothetical protein